MDEVFSHHLQALTFTKMRDLTVVPSPLKGQAMFNKMSLVCSRTRERSRDFVVSFL